MERVKEGVTVIVNIRFRKNIVVCPILTLFSPYSKNKLRRRTVATSRGDETRTKTANEIRARAKSESVFCQNALENRRIRRKAEGNNVEQPDADHVVL